MLRRYSWYWTKAFQILDLALLLAAYLIAEARAHQGVWPLDGMLDPIEILVIVGLWVFLTRALALYKSKRLASMARDVERVLLTLTVIYLMVNILDSAGLTNPSQWLLFVALSGGLICGFHALVRGSLRFLRRSGFNQRRLIIYGAGPLGQEVLQSFIDHPWSGMKVVGFIDDDAGKVGRKVAAGEWQVEVLGTGPDARSLVMTYNVHEVIIALPQSAYENTIGFMHSLMDLPLVVRLVPDLRDIVSVQASVDDLWGLPIIGVRQVAIDGFDAALKRSIDFVGAAFGLLLLAPAMLIIGVLIKLDSSGPVLFVQERVGENGRIFRLYKFRTMVPDAEARLHDLVQLEALSQPVFKIKDDPRITRVGRFLRRTSLDELPQLFNVLIGDMSLVGPRPEEKRVVALYNYQQRQRLAAKPGLTGPMQVNGRGELPFDARLALELDYIRDYSLLSDIELLLKTVPAVLTQKGAH